MSPPRVTVAIPTYDRDTYLHEAIASCLTQDYADLEVLVVLDGTTNPRVREVVAGFDDARLRTVEHDRNRGIAAALNTAFREARGELLALLGDDDVCAPDRIRRQVEVFDRHPDTGVVHGDAVVIDERGRTTGEWRSRDFGRRELVRTLVRDHNYLVDSSTMRHRRVFEAIGPCDETLPWEDFSFHLRAARRFRYRHAGGAPLVRYRRHGANASDESARDSEVELVERVLARALDEWPLEELVPELDWAVLDEPAGERRALEVLADAFEKRGVPLPRLAAQTRARARAIATPKRFTSRGSLLMTSFGFNDAGGGTIVPRLAAKELARRGWDVTVFHAAVAPLPAMGAYALREWEEDGVRLIGVHNRPHGLLDLGHPEREVDDPPITAAFAAALDRLRPDVVHLHNLHNLGAALLDETAARGVPAYFSTHNYWLVCPRNYLMRGDGSLCGGPGDCAACVGSHDRDGYERRNDEIRARFARAIDVCLAVSGAVRDTLTAQGYPPEMIDVVRQGMPAAERVWERTGRDRAPGRAGEQLVVGFFGSAYWHKGPQLLVEAAQLADADLRIEIHGEIPDRFAAQLRRMDARGVVELGGHFHPGDLPDLLARTDVAAMPSMWWDCAPLMADECLAGRVPLVAPRMGGLAEVVRHERNGLLFDGLDARDLARQLDRLASEPGLLERLQTGIEPPRPFADYVDELEAYYRGERPSRAAERAAAPAVRWVGDHGHNTSLSIINRHACDALDGVERVDREGRRLDPPLPHAADVEVRHQWPPDLSPAASGRLAVIQPWEFGAVPREWVEQIEANVDELWVPSEFVRAMYVASGVEPGHVHVVPNGVDLQRFRPDGARLTLPDASGPRFLFVGGFVPRKGPDVLLDAYARAFAGRDDVTLVVKDFGAAGVYRGGDRSALREWVDQGRLPRVVHLEDELDDMAALYRACDVLVHPYRGEGFAMPVLEAMACGLPVITTAGGPTDEFCPNDAAWRIPARRVEMAEPRVGPFETVGRPWMLEPDPARLAELLREAAADADARERKGAAGARAAQRLGWDSVGERYRERIRTVATTAPRACRVDAEMSFEEDVERRVLAAPAWRGQDRLEELLHAWCEATNPRTSACLYLLADPATDGSTDAILERVLGAGVDLDAAADVTVLVPPLRARGDEALHAASDAYIPLHRGAAGHVRRARAAGNAVLEPDSRALRAWLGGEPEIAALSPQTLLDATPADA
jgi:glycosyltransferase involved in cell wall biosynthesis